MAKQTGPNFFIGTIGMVCFYKRGGQYLMRTKSSLTADMVKKSNRFVNTRKSAGELATASRLASQAYRSLSKEKRNVTLYRKMTGIAKVMLKQGLQVHVIIDMLKDHAGNVSGKHQLPLNDQQMVHQQLSKADHGKWMVNKEGRLLTCRPEDSQENIQLPKREERRRYFKISNRSITEITEIVNPVIDQTFLALVAFLGFRLPRSRRYLKGLVKNWPVRAPAREAIFPTLNIHE